MKKIFAGIVTIGLALAVCGTIVSARSAEPLHYGVEGTPTYDTVTFSAGSWRESCFVDTDGDGICDNAGSMCIHADSDGDGACDICGTNGLSCLTGNGTFFADADGDGICDNCGTYHWCGMAGAGGGNFVDADGDGVCDNYVEGQGRGNGFHGRCGRYYTDTDGNDICDNHESGRCHGRGHGCGWSGRGNGSRGGHCR